MTRRLRAQQRAAVFFDRYTQSPSDTFPSWPTLFAAGNFERELPSGVRCQPKFLEGDGDRDKVVDQRQDGKVPDGL
jgi:hypothetical protein